MVDPRIEKQMISNADSLHQFSEIVGVCIQEREEMASNHDIENADAVRREDVSVPLIVKKKVVDHEEVAKSRDSLFMVLLGTIVAVCGSFEFGCIIGFSAPTQLGIMMILVLSLSEYSVLGSADNEWRDVQADPFLSYTWGKHLHPRRVRSSTCSSKQLYTLEESYAVQDPQ